MDGRFGGRSRRLFVGSAALLIVGVLLLLSYGSVVEQQVASFTQNKDQLSTAWLTVGLVTVARQNATSTYDPTNPDSQVLSTLHYTLKALTSNIEQFIHQSATILPARFASFDGTREQMIRVVVVDCTEPDMPDNVAFHTLAGQHAAADQRSYSPSSLSVEFIQDCNALPDPNPFDATRWGRGRPIHQVIRSRRHARHLVALFAILQKRYPSQYFLFMEDDFDTCPHAFDAIASVLQVANERTGGMAMVPAATTGTGDGVMVAATNIGDQSVSTTATPGHSSPATAPPPSEELGAWSAVRVSFGVAGFIIHGQDLAALSSYVWDKQGRSPLVQLLDIWAGIQRDALDRSRPLLRFRCNLLTHQASSQSVIHGDQTARWKLPTCYDRTNPIRNVDGNTDSNAFVSYGASEFDYTNCNHDLFTPCRPKASQLSGQSTPANMAKAAQEQRVLAQFMQQCP